MFLEVLVWFWRKGRSGVVIRSLRWAIPGPSRAPFLGASRSRTTTPDLPPEIGDSLRGQGFGSLEHKIREIGGLFWWNIIIAGVHGIDLVD